MSIVICGGLKRTGSVAMFQVMREIVEVKGVGTGDFRGRRINEMVSNWVYAEGVLVLKYHRYRAVLDPYVNLVKVVMTIRDPRDILVSLMNKYGYTFNRAADSSEFRGNFFSYYRWIEKIPESNLLVIKYEDFWNERKDTIQEVAEFMGFLIGDDEAIEVSKKWSIYSNVARAEQELPVTHKEYVPKRHIHSGEPGQWQYKLNEIQAQEVLYVAEEWMEEVGY